MDRKVRRDSSYRKWRGTRKWRRLGKWRGVGRSWERRGEGEVKST